MRLEKAIGYAIEREGAGIICTSRLYNYLNDLQAFDTPAVKSIVSTMVSEGYFAKLYPFISKPNYDIQSKDAEYRLVHTYGFIPNLVRYVLDCLEAAVQKGHDANVTTVINVAENAYQSGTKDEKPAKITSVLDGEYTVILNGILYRLNEKQLSAFKRKKSLPTEALEKWLRKYDTINKKTKI